MKTIKNRVLPVVIAMLMVFTALPLDALIVLAQEDEMPFGNETYVQGYDSQPVHEEYFVNITDMIGDDVLGWQGLSLVLEDMPVLYDDFIPFADESEDETATSVEPFTIEPIANLSLTGTYSGYHTMRVTVDDQLEDTIIAVLTIAISEYGYAVVDLLNLPIYEGCLFFGLAMPLNRVGDADWRKNFFVIQSTENQFQFHPINSWTRTRATESVGGWSGNQAPAPQGEAFHATTRENTLAMREPYTFTDFATLIETSAFCSMCGNFGDCDCPMYFLETPTPLPVLETVVRDTQMIVQWGAVAGADRYIINYSLDGHGGRVESSVPITTIQIPDSSGNMIINVYANRNRGSTWVQSEIPLTYEVRVVSERPMPEGGGGLFPYNATSGPAGIYYNRHINAELFLPPEVAAFLFTGDSFEKWFVDFLNGLPQEMSIKAAVKLASNALDLKFPSAGSTLYKVISTGSHVKTADGIITRMRNILNDHNLQRAIDSCALGGFVQIRMEVRRTTLIANGAYQGTNVDFFASATPYNSNVQPRREYRTFRRTSEVISTFRRLGIPLAFSQAIINSPVDLDIYENERLIASTRSNEVTFDYYGTTVFIDEERKIVYIPFGRNYDFLITAFCDGVMSYSIQSLAVVDFESEETIEILDFVNIPLSLGQTMSSQVSGGRTDTQLLKTRNYEIVAIFDETGNVIEDIRVVTFNKNACDANARQSRIAVETNAEFGNLFPSFPNRPGHDFMGWNTQADGSGIDFAPGTIITNDITVYAQWEIDPRTYTVTFFAEGAESIPESQIKNHDLPLYLSDVIPTREGINFIAWVTDTLPPRYYQPSDIFTANEDTTLRAVWFHDSYDITFDRNGIVVNNMPGARIKLHDIQITLPTTIPTNANHHFMGWELRTTDPVTIYQPGEPFEKNEDVTLFAKWELFRYDVNFDANGGAFVCDCVDHTQEKLHGINLVLMSCEPVRADYVFIGWHTFIATTIASHHPGGNFTGNTDTTFYAIWRTARRVTFDANGGSDPPPPMDFPHNLPHPLPSDTPVRDGYAFIGWNPDGNATTVTHRPGENFFAFEDVTLYAVWVRIAGVLANNILTPVSVTNEGQVVVFEFTPTTDGNFVFQSRCESNRAVVGSLYSAGVHLATNTNWNGQFQIDHTFTAGNTYHLAARFNATTATGEFGIILRTTYTVSYNLNGGNWWVVGNLNQQKLHDVPLTLIDNRPTKNNFNFLGWATNSTAIVAEFQPRDVFYANTNTVLYAVWENIAPDGTLRLTVTASTETANIGDSITFTVSMGNATNLGAFSFDIVLPDGLSYVAGSGAIAPGFQDAIGHTTVNFADDLVSVSAFGAAVGGYTGPGLTIATFVATATAEGSQTVTLTNADFFTVAFVEIGTFVTPVTVDVSSVATVPDTPTSVNAIAGDGKAAVSFIVSNDGGNEIIEFTVMAYPSGVSASGTSSPIIVTGLTNGETYTFTVIATNLVGSSVASVASNPVIPTSYGVYPPTVTFDLNGGHLASMPLPEITFTTSFALTFAFGEQVGILPQMPTGAVPNGISKERHRFTGWFTDITNETTRWRSDTIAIRDVTLYARWEEIPDNGDVGFNIGSVNGSGRVTSADATMIARWLIDNNSVDMCHLTADINGDGEVTLADLTLLARWLVGQNVRDLIAH